MSRPEVPSLLPRESTPGAPVFEEPWHAQVLAIADSLTRAGLFSAGEWAAARGASLRSAAAAGAADDQTTYYQAALTALEALVADRSPETGQSLPVRIETWRRAYLNTPHGKPVELAAGETGPD